MEETLRYATLLNIVVNGFRLVICIRVQRLIGNNVVFQKSLQILLTVLAEKETVDLGAQLLEGKIGRGKKGSTDMVRSVCDSGQETGLCKAKFKCTELAGEKLNDAGDLRRRDK